MTDFSQDASASWWAGRQMSPTGTPLPLVQHAALAPELQAKPNLLIIGDIHGCVGELRALLDKVGFDPATWALVSVGDIVAKGPGSVACLQLLRQAGAAAVRGNHEDNVLEAMVALREAGEHKELASQFAEPELRWLGDLPLTLRLPHVGPGPGVRIVHAGLLPGAALEEQAFVDLLWMRDVKDGVGLKKPQDGSTGWAAQWEGPEHVVFGHDAQRFVQQHPFATGLDSGCCYGHCLTAIRVRVTGDPAACWADRELVSVPAARMYSQPTRRGAMVGESPCPKQLKLSKAALDSMQVSLSDSTSEGPSDSHMDSPSERASQTPTKSGDAETPTKAPWQGELATPKRGFASLASTRFTVPSVPSSAKRACQVSAS